MKRTKAVLCISLSLIMAFCALSFVACNKSVSKPVSVNDIYKDSASIPAFTSAEPVINLPSGWEVLLSTSSKTSLSYKLYSDNADSGYVKELDAFIVTNGEVLSMIKCGSNDLLFPVNMAISAIRVSKGYILVKSHDGTVSVYNSNGKVLISRKNIVNASSANIDDVVKVLSPELIAVAPAYDANKGESGYNTIYRVSTGKPACRVKNDGAAISNLSGFDNDFVLASASENGDETNRIFKIPSGDVQTIENLSGTQKGTFVSNGEEEYYAEVTYMGDGKFFVAEDWHSTKDDYDYSDGDVYYKNSRHIYNANDDTLSVFERDYYFLNLSNKYYDGSRSGIAPSSFLNDGYFYASYGVTVHGEDKEGWYDQFILDKDLNIVISLSGNFGIEIDSIKNSTEVNYFDLALKFTDGVGIVPILSSKLRAIDRNGKTLFETDDEYSIVTATLNNGMIVCTTVINNTTMYGAYNTQGKLVVPFEYTNIDPFLGYYTIAEKTVDGSKTRVLLGKDGKELTAMSDFTAPLADMTMGTSTAGKSVAMYKTGCYCFNKEIDGTTYFGVKNLDANVTKNVLIDATMVTGSFLYAPTNYPTSVFVFAKFSTDGAFTIYRLK